MKKFAAALLLLALVFGTFPGIASAESAVTRLKDISKVQGVRSNQLMGYGLVVGLNGTGDGSSSGETLQSIANMLISYGINVNTSSIKLKNAAAVMVTATLPPFVREGDALDVTVSSIGDAKSLRGGTLLQTPLKAGNGEVYVVAQGAVSTGGFTAGSGGSSVQAAFPTVGGGRHRRRRAHLDLALSRGFYNGVAGRGGDQRTVWEHRAGCECRARGRFDPVLLPRECGQFHRIARGAADPSR